MVTICKIDIHKYRFLHGNVKLECADKSYEKRSLFDTGATISHMSYGLWQYMGLDELLFNDNPPLMKLLGIKSKDDLAFDSLPMIARATILGDDTRVRTYEFCLDTLALGVQSLSYQPIRLKNITVRLIDSPELQFIVGWNVLKYLNIDYKASQKEAICKFELTVDGRLWLEDDRKEKIANFMTSRFNYLSVDTQVNGDKD
ncbi:MAG: hypothetical protein FWG63_09635 [Defluviitaleaceae bacterium]|nr:hypothetical protein [Defluviitaleaceae bacterium]